MKYNSEKFIFSDETDWQPAGIGVERQIMGYDDHIMLVKVKFEMDDKVVEGKAVLNPQYKNLNLYDKDMNRINTNKPLEGLEQENKHEKNNVKGDSR